MRPQQNIRFVPKASQIKAATARLVGRRVFLRHPRLADRAEFMALNRASVRWHRGLVAAPVNPRMFADYLARSRRPDSELFLICRRSDSAIVGAMNLGRIFRRNSQSASLGYYLGSAFAGQGYATAAIQLLLGHAFRQLKLHRVEANIQPGNIPSIALVKRAGFVCEGFSRRYLKIGGRWRDHERWAILAEDWRRQRR